MATVFLPVLSPTVFWQIENYKTCDKMSSPNLKSFGLRWKLKFIRIMGQYQQVFQIYLESLSRIENLQNKTIDCEVKIDKINGLNQTTSVPLDCMERCVWSYSYSDLMRYGPVNDILFIIKLTPTVEVFDEKLFKEDLSRQEEMENFPYLKRFTEDFGSLYNKQELGDFELKCGQFSFAVHKAVLSARCGYFSLLFRSTLRESDKKYMELKYIDPDILQLVIQYMYTENLPELPLDSIRKVYAVADRFLFESLKMKCHSLMIDSFVKEDSFVQLSSGNGAKNQVKENAQDNLKKELMKQLFLSREWGVLSDEFPALVNSMCRPILLGIV